MGHVEFTLPKHYLNSIHINFNPFRYYWSFLFYSMAKRICKGNGCHAQHSNLCQLEHRYKDELKTCIKRNGKWVHNVTSWRRCCHWQIVFFCFVEWILLKEGKNCGFISFISVFRTFLISKIIAQYETTDKKNLRTRQFYVLSVAYRGTI